LDLGIRAPHRAAIYDDATPVGRAFRVDRTRGAMDALLAAAQAGADGPCEFVMEPTGLMWLPLAAELSFRGHRVYVPKPHKTKALRKFFAQHAKTDCNDASVAARIRHVDPDGVHALRVPRPEQTMLKLHLRQRARLVETGARARQRVHAWLELANPHLHAAFDGELFSKPAMAFLRKYVDPYRVRRLGRGRLERFLNRHGRKSVSERRHAAVWNACVTTCDLYRGMHDADALPFDYVLLQEMVASELDLIAFLADRVRQIDQTVGQLYRQLDPERILETQVPGVGPTIAAAVEAWVGDVERFGNESRFAAYFGLVPRSRQTGVGDGTNSQRITKGGPALLKQYLFLAAEVGRRLDPELAATYARAVDRGHHHYSAVIIVAHKLLRKIHAILKQRAAARRARAQRRVAAPVAYRYLHPQTGERLTREQARNHVAVHFPTKASLRRAHEKATGAESGADEKATGTPRRSGSLESAAGGNRAAPPDRRIPKTAACGKAVDEPVENVCGTDRQGVHFPS
jgi:transposase